MKNILLGFDFSITGPSLCIHESNDDSFSFNNCRFIYITKTKKYADIFLNGQLTGVHYDGTGKHWTSRFDYLSDVFMKEISKYNVKIAAIEGYSMGSKNGRITDIAECTGILKYKMYKAGIQMIVPAPTEIKKFFTGKGSADKTAMYNQWLAETNVNLVELMAYDKKKIESPVSDIVDSYAVCKFLHKNKIN